MILPADARPSLTPITEEDGDDDDEDEANRGSSAGRLELSLGELMVLPLIVDGVEDRQQVEFLPSDRRGSPQRPSWNENDRTFTADELYRAHSIVVTINASRMRKVGKKHDREPRLMTSSDLQSLLYIQSLSSDGGTH